MCKEIFKSDEELLKVIDEQKKKQKNEIDKLNPEADLEIIDEELKGKLSCLLNNLESKKKEFKDMWAIYIFYFDEEFLFDNDVLKRYNKAKTKCQMARCPSENSMPEEATKYLYVGSSQDLYTRLKQHLSREVVPSTYALHLNAWLDTNLPINIKIIKMKMYNENMTNEEKAKKMQAYEDFLWEVYQPILGKQGKNKFIINQQGAIQ